MSTITNTNWANSRFVAMIEEGLERLASMKMDFLAAYKANKGQGFNGSLPDEAIASTTRDLPVDEIIALVMKAGQTAVTTIDLLDEANSATYGHPEIIKANIGVGTNPASRSAVTISRTWKNSLNRPREPGLMTTPMAKCCQPTIIRLLRSFRIKPISTMEEEVAAMMDGR